jgi:hypothetical protein
VREAFQKPTTLAYYEHHGHNIGPWVYLQDASVFLGVGQLWRKNCNLHHLTALMSGANVIKLFTAVIYHHSMVIPTFRVIKLCYPENYCGMAVNYNGILTLEKVGLKVSW